jgi:hypothetical protein
VIVDLSQQRVGPLRLFVGRINEGAQRRTAQVRALANVRTAELVCGIKYEMHRRPSMGKRDRCTKLPSSWGWRNRGSETKLLHNDTCQSSHAGSLARAFIPVKSYVCCPRNSPPELAPELCGTLPELCVGTPIAELSGLPAS